MYLCGSTTWEQLTAAVSLVVALEMTKSDVRLNYPLECRGAFETVKKKDDFEKGVAADNDADKWKPAPQEPETKKPPVQNKPPAAKKPPSAKKKPTLKKVVLKKKTPALAASLATRAGAVSAEKGRGRRNRGTHLDYAAMADMYRDTQRVVRGAEGGGLNKQAFLRGANPTFYLLFHLCLFFQSPPSKTSTFSLLLPPPPFPTTTSAIFSAIIITGAFKFPDVMFGMRLASHTLNPLVPFTLPSDLHTKPIAAVPHGW